MKLGTTMMASVEPTATPAPAAPAPELADPGTEQGAGTGSARRLERTLAVCLVVELVVVVVALAIIGARPAPSGTQDGTASIDEPVAATAGEAAALIGAWERSLDGEYALTGTMTRIALSDATLSSSSWSVATDDAATTVWPYRYIRSGDRALTQIGEVASIIDPTGVRHTCLRQTAGFACSPGPAADEPAGSTPAVRAALSGDTATHRVEAVDPTEVRVDYPVLPADIDCWELVTLTDGRNQRWGRRTQFCFHRPSGGTVFRRTLTVSRLEVLVVDSVSTSVVAADLDPK